MRKPKAGIVATLTLPFLMGCFGMTIQALPSAPERANTRIAGVVLGEGPDAENIDFQRVDHVAWTDSSVTMIGALNTTDANGRDVVMSVTRTFDLDDISAIRVRELDVNMTSAVIAIGFLGPVAVLAVLLSGRSGTAQAPGGQE